MECEAHDADLSASALPNFIDFLPPEIERLIPRDSDGEVLSLGSLQHAFGDCAPCVFATRGGCSNGAKCLFCHESHSLNKHRRARKKNQFIRPEYFKLTPDKQLEYFSTLALMEPPDGVIPAFQSSAQSKASGSQSLPASPNKGEHASSPPKQITPSPSLPMSKIGYSSSAAYHYNKNESEEQYDSALNPNVKDNMNSNILLANRYQSSSHLHHQQTISFSAANSSMAPHLHHHQQQQYRPGAQPPPPPPPPHQQQQQQHMSQLHHQANYSGLDNNNGNMMTAAEIMVNKMNPDNQQQSMILPAFGTNIHHAHHVHANACSTGGGNLLVMEGAPPMLTPSQFSYGGDSGSPHNSGTGVFSSNNNNINNNNNNNVHYSMNMSRMYDGSDQQVVTANNNNNFNNSNISNLNVLRSGQHDNIFIHHQRKMKASIPKSLLMHNNNFNQQQQTINNSNSASNIHNSNINLSSDNSNSIKNNIHTSTANNNNNNNNNNNKASSRNSNKKNNNSNNNNSSQSSPTFSISNPKIYPPTPIHIPKNSLIHIPSNQQQQQQHIHSSSSSSHHLQQTPPTSNSLTNGLSVPNSHSNNNSKSNMNAATSNSSLTSPNAVTQLSSSINNSPNHINHHQQQQQHYNNHNCGGSTGIQHHTSTPSQFHYPQTPLYSLRHSQSIYPFNNNNNAASLNNTNNVNSSNMQQSNQQLQQLNQMGLLDAGSNLLNSNSQVDGYFLQPASNWTSPDPSRSCVSSPCLMNYVRFSPYPQNGNANNKKYGKNGNSNPSVLNNNNNATNMLGTAATTPAGRSMSILQSPNFKQQQQSTTNSTNTPINSAHNNHSHSSATNLNNNSHGLIHGSISAVASANMSTGSSRFFERHLPISQNNASSVSIGNKMPIGQQQQQQILWNHSLNSNNQSTNRTSSNMNNNSSVLGLTSSSSGNSALGSPIDNNNQMVQGNTSASNDISNSKSVSGITNSMTNTPTNMNNNSQTFASSSNLNSRGVCLRTSRNFLAEAAITNNNNNNNSNNNYNNSNGSNRVSNFHQSLGNASSASLTTPSTNTPINNLNVQLNVDSNHNPTSMDAAGNEEHQKYMFESYMNRLNLQQQQQKFNVVCDGSSSASSSPNLLNTSSNHIAAASYTTPISSNNNNSTSCGSSNTRQQPQAFPTSNNTNNPSIGCNSSVSPAVSKFVKFSPSPPTDAGANTFMGEGASPLQSSSYHLPPTPSGSFCLPLSSPSCVASPQLHHLPSTPLVYSHIGSAMERMTSSSAHSGSNITQNKVPIGNGLNGNNSNLVIGNSIMQQQQQQQLSQQPSSQVFNHRQFYNNGSNNLNSQTPTHFSIHSSSNNNNQNQNNLLLRTNSSASNASQLPHPSSSSSINNNSNNTSNQNSNIIQNNNNENNTTSTNSNNGDSQFHQLEKILLVSGPQ